MKIQKIKMGRFLYEKINKPIRRKRDIILLLLETMKLFANPDEEVTNGSGEITIYIDKMSRVIYELKEKYFSFVFPFSVELQKGNCKFYDGSTECDLDDKMISLLISIFQQQDVIGESFEKALDAIIECAEEYEYKDIDIIWRLMLKLWYMEDGYIRYDYDLERSNGGKHPLNHLDVNYSMGTTYKIGLKNAIQMKEFVEILNINSDCAYLQVS